MNSVKRRAGFPVGVLVAEFAEFRGDAFLQPLVFGEAEAVVDVVLLAPVHDGIAGEAAVAAQDDAHFFAEAAADGG